MLLIGTENNIYRLTGPGIVVEIINKVDKNNLIVKLSSTQANLRGQEIVASKGMDILNITFTVEKKYFKPYSNYIFKGIKSCIKLENQELESKHMDQATALENSVGTSILDDYAAIQAARDSRGVSAISLSTGEFQRQSIAANTLIQSIPLEWPPVSFNALTSSAGQVSQYLTSRYQSQRRGNG